MSDVTVELYESRVGDFFTLLKPRVMSLVVFTGLAGMWVAPGFTDMHPFLIFSTILALAIGSGASGAINMWYDRDIDAVMNRTKDRPLPAGRVDPNEALGFAVVLTVFSVLLMGLSAGWLAAFLLAGASAYYVFIYTMWLKRLTPQNIVIGGAAGAFPPMIGYAAVTGDITLYAVILFTIIFVWTPPHFWALSLFANKDYERAKVPMMPLVKGEAYTKKQILIYSLLLWPVAMAPYIFGYAGLIYGVSAFLLSGLFVVASYKILKDETLKSAKVTFGYSVFYLFALFVALIVDHIDKI